MDTYTCGICKELLSEGVHCTACNQQLHFHCAGITESGFRKLGDRKLTWRCGKCKQVGPGQGLPPNSPSRAETDATILMEIRTLSAKLAPLESLKEEVLALRREFADLKLSLSEANQSLRDLNTKFSDMDRRITQVEKTQEQVNLVQSRLDKLEEDCNDRDQWSRLNNVEIKGLTQTSTENLFEIVSKIDESIQYPVTKNHINFVTRVPTREKDKTKPVIVCFCSRYAKEDFVAAARYTFKTAALTSGQLGLPGNERIYINDHLTVKNKALLSKAKKVADELDFRYVWIKHAKIHVRRNDTSPVIVVKTEKDLTKII